MSKRYVVPLLVLLVLADLALTFGQNYLLPLDGDLAPIVVPSPWYQAVLHDPFGWAVLTKNEVYAAPNRFFAHAAMVGYWRYVPRGLQVLASPIDSIYLAGALFNTSVQAVLLGLLASYIRPALPGAGRCSWWLAAALLAPLFQMTSFNAQMGILSRSWTYTFFYAFPLALLLLWLLPFYQSALREQRFRLGWPLVLGWLGLAVVLAFNGPVVTAAVAVLLLGVAAHGAWTWQRAGAGPAWWSGQALGLGLWLGGLCAYSLYIGRNNAENSHDFTFWELYQKLPQGVINELKGKLGLPLLLGFILLNAQLVRRYTLPSPAGRRVQRVLRWVGWFTLIYLLLLPFGGYRSYRAYLVRNDAILPVLLGLIFAYGLSTLHLLRELPAATRRWYVGGLALLLAVFINADRKLWVRENNYCERASLAQLAQAPEAVVHLPADCKVMSWEPIADPAQSATPADLLYYWGITPIRKRYYQ